jgi:hypothetical protein
MDNNEPLLDEEKKEEESPLIYDFFPLPPEWIVDTQVSVTH